MKIELNHIYNGDCLALFKEMRDNSVDLIVTDPPYRITSRGGTGTMSGFMTETRSKNGKIFTHNDIDIAEYLPEFYRVLKNGTHCYIMCNNVNLPHFFEVIGKSPFHFTKNFWCGTSKTRFAALTTCRKWNLFFSYAKGLTVQYPTAENRTC